VQGRYRLEPDFFSGQSETLSRRALVAYLGDNSTTSAAGTVQDATQSQTRPEFSGVVTSTYTLGTWGLMMQARYYDSVMNNKLWTEGRDIDDNWIASQTTFNTALSYECDNDLHRVFAVAADFRS